MTVNEGDPAQRLVDYLAHIHQPKEHAFIADLNVDEPANKRVWYLPLTRHEHKDYPTREAAQTAADHICPIEGVPFVTPLSRKAR